MIETVTTRAMELSRPDSKEGSGKYRMVAQIVGKQGTRRMGLCTHAHETPEAAMGCQDALNNVATETFKSDDPVVVDIFDDIRAWLDVFEHERQQRRFARIDYTVLEQQAADIFERMVKEFRP